MPPRHSKSIHVSQLFPAFVVGKNKDYSVIVSSYSGDLATDHGRETRNMISGQAYQNVFDTRLAEDSSAKGKWNTNGKGAYNAVGVGGSATGKGADYFIVDDPFKDRKEADSELIREERWKWFRSVARTRLTPDGCMIVMHTRWHDDDLIGRITKEDSWMSWEDYKDKTDYKPLGDENNPKWVRMSFPAIAEQDEPYRASGEALWPARYPISELLDIKRTLGSFEWSALYQQSPIDSESQEFKKSMFLPVTRKEVFGKRTRNFITIDTAISKAASSDYTGVVRNYVCNENKWHISSQQYKISPKELIDLIFALYDEDKPEKIGIEKTIYLDAIKPFLDEEMRKRSKFLPIVELDHKQTAKEIRVRSLLPRYESKSIMHIEGENEALEEQLLRFPKGIHDDVIDALAYQSQIAQAPSFVDARQADIFRRNINRQTYNDTH